MTITRLTVGAVLCLAVMGPNVRPGPIAANSKEVRAAGLSGLVRGPDGPMAGVAVYAKGLVATITTTVFSDEAGQYVFPPMAPGSYRLWAQAVGFEPSRVQETLQPGKRTSKAFVLTPIADTSPQLSEAEWMAALPTATKEQRRMKEILRVNCSMCHSIASIFQHRFDEHGWLNMVDQMAKHNRDVRRVTVEHHKEELAKYLASVRGPNSPPLNITILPRPSRDAARVVFTTYDIPLENTRDGMALRDGTDWTLGRATHRGYLNHDLAIGADGTVWLTVFPPPNKTIDRLDIATGQVTSYAIPNVNGSGTRLSHGITSDKEGRVYFTAVDSIGRVDPRTDRFDFFKVPTDLKLGVSNDLDIATDGAVWASTSRGALRLDPITRAWKHFQSVNVLDGSTYGVAADADNNGWWTQWGVSRVGKGETKTGKSFEILMEPPWMEDEEDVRTAEDRQFYDSIGAEGTGGINMVPRSMAPRRMGADRNGPYVYVANFNGENIARINARTLETTYYRMPIPSHPYRVVVDAQHNAWTASMSDDWLMRLDAKTARWSLYQLPVLNCDTRYVVSDHVRDEIWVPCGRTSSAVRMQFRTSERLQVDKGGTLPPLKPPFSVVKRTGPLPKVDPEDPVVTRRPYDMRLVVEPGPLTDDQRRGRDLFAGSCGICHTRPEGPWIDQTTVQTRGEEWVRRKIMEGSPLMPAQRYSLNAHQLDQIVAYLKVRTSAEKPSTPFGWW